jgi:hypothetical protein
MGEKLAPKAGLPSRNDDRKKRLGAELRQNLARRKEKRRSGQQVAEPGQETLPAVDRVADFET